MAENTNKAGENPTNQSNNENGLAAQPEKNGVAAEGASFIAAASNLADELDKLITDSNASTSSQDEFQLNWRKLFPEDHPQSYEHLSVLLTSREMEIVLLKKDIKALQHHKQQMWNRSKSDANKMATMSAEYHSMRIYVEDVKKFVDELTPKHKYLVEKYKTLEQRLETADKKFDVLMEKSNRKALDKSSALLQDMERQKELMDQQKSQLELNGALLQEKEDLINQLKHSEESAKSQVAALEEQIRQAKDEYERQKCEFTSILEQKEAQGRTTVETMHKEYVNIKNIAKKFQQELNNSKKENAALKRLSDQLHTSNTNLVERIRLLEQKQESACTSDTENDNDCDTECDTECDTNSLKEFKKRLHSMKEQVARKNQVIKELRMNLGVGKSCEKCTKNDS